MPLSRSAWAHGGEDHGSAAPESQQSPQDIPSQTESSPHEAVQPAQAASGAPTSAEVTPGAGVVAPQQNSVLAQIPNFGPSESLFGLILIAPFALTLLRRQAQNARKLRNQSVK